MNARELTTPATPFKVHAIRYATVARRQSENFIGGDAHEAGERIGYFDWLPAMLRESSSSTPASMRLPRIAAAAEALARHGARRGRPGPLRGGAGA
jgi:hypothetical protein